MADSTQGLHAMAPLRFDRSPTEWRVTNHIGVMAPIQWETDYIQYSPPPLDPYAPMDSRAADSTAGGDSTRPDVPRHSLVQRPITGTVKTPNAVPGARLECKIKYNSPP